MSRYRSLRTKAIVKYQRRHKYLKCQKSSPTSQSKAPGHPSPATLAIKASNATSSSRRDGSDASSKASIHISSASRIISGTETLEYSSNPFIVYDETGSPPTLRGRFKYSAPYLQCIQTEYAKDPFISNRVKRALDSTMPKTWLPEPPLTFIHLLVDIVVWYILNTIIYKYRRTLPPISSPLLSSPLIPSHPISSPLISSHPTPSPPTLPYLTPSPLTLSHLLSPHSIPSQIKGYSTVPTNLPINPKIPISTYPIPRPRPPHSSPLSSPHESPPSTTPVQTPSTPNPLNPTLPSHLILIP